MIHGMKSDLADVLREVHSPHYYNDAVRQVMREVPGMSGFRCLSQINEAVKYFHDCRYLEIGLFKGLSARAAMAGNEEKHFTLCDSFEQESVYGPYEDECRANLFSGHPQDATLVKGDGIKVMREHIMPPIDVFYYDGNHSFESTYTALSLARFVCAESAIVFIDDTNYQSVRQAMYQGAKDFGFRVVQDVQTVTGHDPDWWNGWAILVRGSL